MIIGLASRAEITFFDEPYLGLDAVARQIFYDRLLEDYSEHPRTVILSSHLIDEVSNLIERVLVIDQGRIIMDEDDGCRARPRRDHRRRRRRAVDDFVAGREVIHRESLGRVTSVTVLGALDAARPRAPRPRSASRPRPVSLQQLIVRLTQHAGDAPRRAPRSRRRHSDEPHTQRRPAAAGQQA